MAPEKEWRSQQDSEDSPVISPHNIHDSQILHRRKETMVFQGILPPPAMLKEYEGILPDAPERLLRFVEKESEARHSVMKQLVADNHREVTAGIFAASVISLSIIGFGVYCVHEGYPHLGLASVAVNVAAIVCAYLKQSKSRDDQPRE